MEYLATINDKLYVFGFDPKEVAFEGTILPDEWIDGVDFRVPVWATGSTRPTPPIIRRDPDDPHHLRQFSEIGDMQAVGYSQTDFQGGAVVITNHGHYRNVFRKRK